MKIRIFLFLSLFVFLFACKKNKTQPVPNIPFDITININLPSYNSLIGFGGWANVSGGSIGIIVYRTSIDEFVAFDRHSPADPEGTCTEPLYPDQDNFLTLIDSCNSATFSLYDGSAITNCDFGLRQYQTQFNGSDQVRIYN